MKKTPWDIPESWEWLRIGDIAAVVGGGTPKTSDPSNFQNGSIPWITPADLSCFEGKFIDRGRRNITERGLKGSSARLLPAGAVLFSSRAPIGYVAIASQPVSTNQGFKSFILPKRVDSSYVYYYLLGSREMIQELGGGTTFKEISGAKAATIPFALPPLPEQRRIVAEIEKYFTRLDAAESALRRVQANLKRYRASVLKAACEGKLVPTEAELAGAEGRDYEHAEQLLERILAERRLLWESQAKKIKKYVEPATPDVSSLPKLPKGWAYATVEQVIVRSEYGTSIKCNYEAEGVPVLRIPNIVAGEVDLADVKFATQSVPLDAQSGLQFGDVLMCRTNGSIKLVGKTAVVSTEFTVFHSFASYLLRFRFAETQVIPRWFHTVVNSQFGRSVIEFNAASSAGQHNVNLKLIHGMVIPLPPFAEQRRILAEVERQLSIIRQNESLLTANFRRIEQLRQSILKQAFSGRLVPQDPEDEPASVLLERIREERAVAEAAKPKRKQTRRRSKTSASSQLALLDSEP